MTQNTTQTTESTSTNSGNDANSSTSASSVKGKPSGQELASKGKENASPAPQDGDNELITDHGRTLVADVVVSKIAGMAAREVTGVHDLGDGAARMVGALRDRIPGSHVNVQQGVSVEVGERQAAVDVAIVAEYGVAIHELAEAIRSNIILSVERMTGLEVTEVNVNVHDVHLPRLDEDEDDEGEKTTPRVR